MRRRFFLAICSTGMLGSLFNIIAAPPRSPVWAFAIGLFLFNLMGLVYELRGGGR